MDLEPELRNDDGGVESREPHPLTDALLDDNFWDDPFYPHQTGKEEWEDNFFGMLNEHLASELTDKSKGKGIKTEEDLEQACAEFVSKWRHSQVPPGRLLRRIPTKNDEWTDIGDKEAAAFIKNRLADSYGIRVSFEGIDNEHLSTAERTKLIFAKQERKTRFVNNSSCTVHAIVADEEIEIDEAEIGRGPGVETTPRGPASRYLVEATVPAGGGQALLDLDQKRYYLTAYTKDEYGDNGENDKVVVHVKNLPVAAKGECVFDGKDLVRRVLKPLSM